MSQRPQRPQRRPPPIAVSLSRYYGDGMLIRAIDVYPHAQNLTTFINVFWMADERMNRLKSNHDFNVESRHGHVWVDARASLRAERRTG
jgi:hypothetical protein